MADMTFKANLLPISDLGKNLGSSTQRWNIYGNILSTSPQLAGATESNEITIKDLGNNDPLSTPSQRHGIDFRWYASHWIIGNLRSTSTPSAGFGFSFSEDGTTYTNKAIIGNDGYITASGFHGKADSAGYIEGTNNAANPNGALLRSGAGRTDASPAGDTWIYWDTLGGTTSYWGIRHNQGANTIGYYGGGNERVVIHLGESKVTATTFAGNATSATKLQTARTINGTAFDGTANIVTSYWGTARTLTIGNTGKSVNGSANVSWSKAEIIGSGSTANFLRGDHAWTSSITGTFTSSASPGFNNTVTAGSWSYLRLHNGSNFWDIATRSDQNSGCLDFRPGGSANMGPRIYSTGLLTVDNIGETSTGTYGEAAMQIREYRYGGSQTDTWGHAPRLTWHWSGRVAAQIGLASMDIYMRPLTLVLIFIKQ